MNGRGIDLIFPQLTIKRIMADTQSLSGLFLVPAALIQVFLEQLGLVFHNRAFGAGNQQRLGKCLTIFWIGSTIKINPDYKIYAGN